MVVSSSIYTRLPLPTFSLESLRYVPLVLISVRYTLPSCFYSMQCLPLSLFSATTTWHSGFLPILILFSLRAWVASPRVWATNFPHNFFSSIMMTASHVQTRLYMNLYLFLTFGRSASTFIGKTTRGIIHTIMACIRSVIFSIITVPS